MWKVNALSLTMTEGDFGVKLPVTINGISFDSNDSIKITIKNKANGTVMLEKEFTNIQNNSVDLEFTEDESTLFPVGVYVYTLDWCQSGIFMCNIIQSAAFRVVDKA